MKKLPLSFLIPVYNDELTIKSVIDGVVKVARELTGDYEIIVINDASTDGTSGKLSEIKKRTKYLTVINHAENAGYGGTIKELYQRARKEWLVSIPGDNQFDAGEIKKLAEKTADYDLILGLRAQRNDPEMRLFQSAIYNLLLRILFRIDIRDVNSIRLMKTVLIKEIPLASHSAFVDAEMVIRALKMGYRVREEPIAHKARAGEGAGGGKLKTILPVIEEMMRFRMDTRIKI
jgi:glycosyltransferase involved in cell wall biosynthesis